MTKAEAARINGKLGGRPRRIETPEEFTRLVDDYVVQCRIQHKPLTWTGMALHLGFAHKARLFEYGDRDGFQFAVNRARMLIEECYEGMLATGQGSAAGIMFLLYNMGKNSRGWDNPRYNVKHEMDPVEHHHTHEIDWSKVDDSALKQIVQATSPLLPSPRKGNGSGVTVDQDGNRVEH